MNACSRGVVWRRDILTSGCAATPASLLRSASISSRANSCGLPPTRSTFRSPGDRRGGLRARRAVRRDDLFDPHVRRAQDPASRPRTRSTGHPPWALSLIDELASPGVRRSRSPAIPSRSCSPASTRCGSQRRAPRLVARRILKAQSDRHRSRGRSSAIPMQVGLRRSSASPMSSASGKRSRRRRGSTSRILSLHGGTYRPSARTSRTARRAPLRRDPVPRPRYRSQRRPDGGVALAHRSRGDARRPAPRRQHADRRGLHHPHRLRTEGIVRSTMPLAVNGQIVRDLTVRFEGGRAVEVSAASGRGRRA